MVDSVRSWLQRCVLVSIVAPGVGCSDDGLAPAAGDSGAGGTTTGAQATSNVNTSATVTASASGEGSGADDGPLSDTGDSSGAPGAESTGGYATGTDTDTGAEGVDTDDVPGTTGGEEPSCVVSEDCACDPGEVICEVVPPECPPGTLPEVDPAVMCWTMECVPADSCVSVPDCMACAQDLACVVVEQMAGPTFTCEPIPPACMEGPACACMPDACPMPYECVDVPMGDADLGCICELC